MGLAFGHRVLVLGLLLGHAVGCAQTVNMRTDRPGALVLDGEEIGPIDEGGLDVEVDAGLDPVAFTVRDGDRSYSGIIERQPVSGWVDGSIVGMSGLSSATCGACGLSLANPGCGTLAIAGIFPPLLVGFAYGTCSLLSVAPGWLSAPLACVGCAVGSSPLLLLGIAPQPVAENLLLTPQGAVDLNATDEEVPP